MKEKFIKFFIKRHLLTNLIFVFIFIGGFFAWKNIPKEELPDVTFDFVRISVKYPGATAEEVEYFVTKPVEEAVRYLDGVYRVMSSTGVGSCSVTVEIENNYPDKDEVITEIRNEVMDVDLPEDIIDDPDVRVFKTSRKAIIDIGFIDKTKNILDTKSRQRLQTYAVALENNLLNLPEISSVSRNGYLRDEIHIKILPEKLKEYNIPFNTVMNEIKDNNVRQPAGSIENIRESKVTLSAELDTVDELAELSIQGGFEGNIIRLKDVAKIEPAHEKTKIVTKINGHEGVFLNARKNSQYGILDAVNAVERAVESFRKTTLKGTDIDLVLLDDESVDVRNRLRLISINGAIGFILILIVLFLFLNFESGVWVAAGIPFSFGFALLGALFIGYSINNITLAAVIIVMGMVVDDAIVVAENINRNRMSGMSVYDSAVKGTSFVLLPVIASILTTCVAFIPLYFFSGRFGVMVKVIPAVIFLMLGGSLLEAVFILPGHMTLSFGKRVSEGKARLLNFIENKYEKFIYDVLKVKWIVLAVFVLIIALSWGIAKNRMKFVMFPDEETRQIRVSGETTAGMKRYETARVTQKIEDVIASYIGKEVIGFRNDVGRSRWGSAAQENKFRMRVEVLPKEKRTKSADALIKEWEGKTRNIEGIVKLEFSKGRHGQASGSSIEIAVKENNNQRRREISDRLAEDMRKHPALQNVEVDRPVYNPEYKLTLDRDKIRRLAINPSDISKTLRSALEGSILYEFEGDDETVYVRLTTVSDAKDDIEKIFSIPVENQGQYLVPLGDVVFMEEVNIPDSISREDSKRVTIVYANVKEKSEVTPLDIAEYFEKNIFPAYKEEFPTAILEFKGEVKDTRESGKDFNSAIVMALLLIFIIMALLFNSLLKPLMIMLAIPFGLAGVVLAFQMHGINLYGFFTIIGCIGLAGVVVNDAIIMMVRLDNDFDENKEKSENDRQISAIAKTRLRAVMLTTITTVAGIIPTAYGWAGYDGMLAQMMLAIAWGLVFSTLITLVLVPCIYSVYKSIKRNKASIAVFLFFVLLFGPKVLADELSVNDFIETACGNDKEFEEILIDNLDLAYEKALALPARDLVISVKSEYNVFVKSGKEEPEYDVSLSKLFPYTDTEVSGGYETTSSDGVGTVSSEYNVKVSQPIARNAFGYDTRLLDKITGLEIDVARYQIVEAYETYLSSSIQLYYNWCESFENLKTAEKSYNENLKLLENVDKRHKQNIALPVDVNKVKVQVMDKEENLIDKKIEHEQNTNLLRRSLRVGDEVELIPGEGDKFEDTSADFEKDYAVFRKNSRTSQILDMMEKKSDFKVDRYADALLPSIDLYAEYVVGADDRYMEKDDKKTLAGISVEYPFPGQVERAEYQQSKIALKRTILNNQNTHDGIRVSLKNIYEDIEKEKELIEIAEKRIKVAQAIVDDDTVNYSYGKINLNNFIDEVNQLDTARFSKIQHSIRLKKLIIQWLALTDKLVVKASDILGNNNN